MERSLAALLGAPGWREGDREERWEEEGRLRGYRLLLARPDPGMRVRKEEHDALGSHLVSPSKLASTLPFPRKSAARQLAGHRGSSQLCVERHQMVCYETHFGQKIAGVFGSWEDNKARKRGVSQERRG